MSIGVYGGSPPGVAGGRAKVSGAPDAVVAIRA
jgi:hypothetical protein